MVTKNEVESLRKGNEVTQFEEGRSFGNKFGNKF